MSKEVEEFLAKGGKIEELKENASSDYYADDRILGRMRGGYSTTGHTQVRRPWAYEEDRRFQQSGKAKREE